MVPVHATIKGDIVTTMKLIAIANATEDSAVFTNTENSGDTRRIDAYSVVFTGGNDSNYSNVPDCSDSTYFDAHHMLVAAGGKWEAAFWNDDNNGHEFQWNGSNNYSTEHSVPDSKAWEYVAILITKDSGGRPVIHVSPWENQ
jgi:hypothetical protein